MENMFENAYFGKAYKTRDGRKAIYIQTFKTGEIRNELVVEDEEMVRLYYLYKDDGSFYHKESCFDIVSEWQETLSEEELDKHAIEERNKYKEQLPFYYEFPHSESDLNIRCMGYLDGFKECYRKVMEGKNASK